MVVLSQAFGIIQFSSVLLSSFMYSCCEDKILITWELEKSHPLRFCLMHKVA